MTRWARIITIVVYCIFSSIHSNAQVRDSLIQFVEQTESQIATYKSILDSLQVKVKSIKEELVVYPKWEKSARGILGIDLNTYDNWVIRKEDLNSTNAIIAVNLDGAINKIGQDYFWKNRSRLRLGWQQITRNEEDDTGFQKTNDLFRIDTHYGRNLSKKTAFSILTELESTFLESSFNPGYLDLSIGLTFTEKSIFSAILHPVNYSVVISNFAEFQSSLGSKFIITYNEKLLDKILVTSEMNGFLSYDGSKNLNVFRWTNAVHIDVFKNLGFGLEYGIRINKQETLAFNPNTDDHFQSYFLMGLSFIL